MKLQREAQESRGAVLDARNALQRCEGERAALHQVCCAAEPMAAAVHPHALWVVHGRRPWDMRMDAPGGILDLLLTMTGVEHRD